MRTWYHKRRYQGWLYCLFIVFVTGDLIRELGIIKGDPEVGTIILLLCLLLML